MFAYLDDAHKLIFFLRELNNKKYLKVKSLYIFIHLI